jgi:hypothetical protein
MKKSRDSSIGAIQTTVVLPGVKDCWPESEAREAIGAEFTTVREVIPRQAGRRNATSARASRPER